MLDKLFDQLNDLDQLEESFNMLLRLVREASRRLLEQMAVAPSLSFAFPTDLYFRLLEKIFDISDASVAIALDALLIKALNTYSDLRFYAYRGFPRMFGQNAMSRAVRILCRVKFSTDLKEKLAIYPAEGYEEMAVLTVKGHRHEHTECWLSILKRLAVDGESGAKLHGKILEMMDERILPHMTRPQLLLDYLTKAYDNGGTLGILALGSLFTLMRRHKLDYPSFYQKLYDLLKDDKIFYSPHRKRFLRLFATFMTSTHLPAYLVAAFMKRLCRLALFAPPAGMLWTIGFCYNMLKSHPMCRVMIHRAEMGKDPYDPNASLEECRAADSCLWELEGLTKHIRGPVARMAQIFRGRLTKPPFKLDDFFDIEEYDQLVRDELKHLWRKRPPIKIDINEQVF